VTLLGKITVVLSDDPRYEAGKSYDVVLTTPQTPNPAELVTGSVDEAEPTQEAVEPQAG